MKYLHLMSNEKFIIPYIEFVEENFLIIDHFFYIIGGVDYVEVIKRNFIKSYISKSSNKILRKLYIIWAYIVLYPKAFKSKKIILHGLFDPLTILFLFLNPWFLKKCDWVMWGGDLYSYRNRNQNTLLKKIYYKIEDYVKGKMSGYITHVEGDYELAKKWCGAKGIYYDCFMYLSNVYRDVELKELSKDEINIQVGNSADPSNNHLEILDKLVKFKEKNIKVFCILSYGDKEWAKKVIEYGKNKLGDKFIPIIDFMKFQEYMEFISKIDIAIFAHNRQQAVGNITSLLSMGKTVYLKKEVTTYRMLKELNIKVEDFNEFNKIELLSEEDRKNNKKIIKNRFSKERLKNDWKIIFEDNIK